MTSASHDSPDPVQPGSGPSAAQVRKLDGRTQRRVQAVVELLAQEPRPTGAKKLVGGHGEWRVRTGNYRIIYEIDDEMLDQLPMGNP